MQTDVIRRISIQATQQGVAEATAGLKNLAVAQNGIVSSSERSEKSSLSVAAAYERQQRSLDLTYRATQQFEKTQRTLDQALQQGLTTQVRHAELTALNAARHDQLAGSQKALGVIASDLNSRLQAQAGSFGVMGQALSALGPQGLAAAAAIGSLAAAFYLASAGAHELAQRSRELKDFSEATGLTVIQVQALRSEATKFGVDSETLQAGLQKFTTGFQDLRLGTGDLLTQIRRINPALADQMAVATDTATAFTLYGKAVAQTTNIFERNALARAGMGKGGTTIAEFIGKVGDVNALTAAYDAAGRGLQKNQIDKWADLDLQITKTTGKARENFASIFAGPVLEAELGFSRTFLQISEAAKNFQLSEGAKTLFSGMLRGAPLIGPWVSLFQSMQAKGSSEASRDAMAAGGSSALAISDAVPRTRTFDQIKADQGRSTETPESIAAKWKNYIDVLGSAATPTERLTAAIAELEIKAKNAGNEGAAALARGIAGLKLDAATAQLNARIGALGASASVTELVAQKTDALNRANREGAGLTPAQIANQQRLTREQSLGTYQIQSQIDAEKIRSATLFMGSEAATSYAISQSIISKAIQDGKPLRDDEIEQIKRKAAELAKVIVANKTTDDLIKTAQQSGAQFGIDLVSRLGNGQMAVESLHNAFKNLASTLTSSAFKDLFEGNFVSAGIKGIAAITAAIFSANTSSSGEKWLKQQKEDMANRQADYASRITLAGVDTNTRAGAVLAQDQQFIRERIAENKSGGQAMTALLQAQVAERNELLKEWDQKDTDLVKANADAKLAIEKAAADRSLGFQNRLFAATNDFDTLQGQLAAFDRAAQQERVTEVQNGGQAIVDLEAAQAAERYNVIKSFNDKTLAAVNATAKTVTDYLNNLVAGPGSTSSPTATLASAQTLYQANLGVIYSPTADAQAKLDAQNKFVSLADNLEKAARLNFASGQGYQDIKSMILSHGLALPAVQATTDPVTAAVRDAIAAINAGNLIASSQLVPAVNAGNASAIAAALQFLDPSGKLASIYNATQYTAQQTIPLISKVDSTVASVDYNSTLTGAGNSTLAAIQGLQTTANQQLTLLKQALSPSVVSVSITGSGNTTPGSTPGVPLSLNNQVVDSLNKIVWNTYVIAQNTEYKADGTLAHTHAGGGTYATGGLITGPGTGTSDSIRAMLSNREFVIKNAAVERFGVGFFEQLNAGIMPTVFNDNRPINVAAPTFRSGDGNSNAELLAEVRALRKEVEQLRRENNSGNIAIANGTSRGLAAATDAICETVEESGKRGAYAITAAAKDNKAA